VCPEGLSAPDSGLGNFNEGGVKPCRPGKTISVSAIAKADTCRKLTL